MSSFIDFQNEIYLGGLGGIVPELPMTAAGLERRAKEVLGPAEYAYVAGSASAERTAAANRAAFDKYRIIPRMLRGTTGPGARDLSVEVLGTRLAAPVLTAPIGVLELMHEGGEVIVAEVTKELGIGSVLSTAASSTIEEVGAVAGEWWYQLYWPNDPELARSFVQRAERAGAKAIVVTVDTPTLGWRPQDLELAHLPFLHGKGIANYLSDPVFRAKLPTPPEESEDAMRIAILTWVGLFGNHNLRAADLAHLREWTDLPIAVKGILHPDDARLVVDAGADAVVVSNHGGRQVDGSIAALDALPAVVASVGDRADVLFDSGVRSGSDVLIALALGAKAVLYGRPYAYGLGIAGRDGARHALRLLLADLDSALGLSGCANVADLNRGTIAAVR
ncbi:FMN-dependent dehydrogenase, includes L-lactate dehydrogenase and type II isopentenyl diphosphate isomerase [Nocardia amikacinitolerans]|uniref:FMN-dependent dehydrogenase, includes L-lactate dehydrogenase and type II isopentenyl diphosphate isomerase n=1 Tax=Nocardia amikacinitolerans TaxID=756689 RepID=A0A285LTY1_9NOCA|nr:alpha-hydroxy-acid oxidizing protein [Nocardia amikacinitolerans]MCP2276920.1 FMN-dependent dehydrogenase, includes L-lactate dehydrogenase and type II isopentenyl diphosphate isomerase [Nocardia amikacinitolerans]MCP2294699.1 FMN-dependent dehydrogenase, includes L-lactate dehydrogenase and type II isopentenyl diphosphate isomerase [Nocardia amikacinitolerans]SNY87126.1 FMN-dependent dehydrogenase, includes L-lactate dehydrogenase and type II isopentenyl diphosphate isomerase [Nocardia amika